MFNILFGLFLGLLLGWFFFPRPQWAINLIDFLIKKVPLLALFLKKSD